MYKVHFQDHLKKKKKECVRRESFKEVRKYPNSLLMILKYILFLNFRIVSLNSIINKVF